MRVAFKSLTYQSMADQSSILEVKADSSIFMSIAQFNNKQDRKM